MYCEYCGTQIIDKAIKMSKTQNNIKCIAKSQGEGCRYFRKGNCVSETRECLK